MTDLRKTRKSQQEKGGFFQRFGRWILGLSSLCLIAVISIKGVDWFGGAVGASWFVFLFTAYALFIWKGGQWCEEKVAGTRALLFLVIIFFLPFIASIIIALFPPEPLPAAHITNILNVKITGPAFAAILGFLLFAQRLDVMNRQADLAQDQVNLAQKQFDLTQRQREVDERRDAYELLASEKVAMRVNGITILGDLARTRPEEWHIRVVNLLADFIRERSAEDENSTVRAFVSFFQTKEKDEKEAEAKWQKLHEITFNGIPADIAEAMRVIACDLTEAQKAVVQKHIKTVRFWPDLRGCWLCLLKLHKAYLPKVLLVDAFLYGTNLIEANLTDATLLCSHLSGTELSGAKLQNTLFYSSDLTGTNFEGATGIKEENLAGCYYIKSKKSPNLPIEVAGLKPISITEYWEKARSLFEERKSLVFQKFDE